MSVSDYPCDRSRYLLVLCSKAFHDVGLNTYETITKCDLPGKYELYVILEYPY